MPIVHSLTLTNLQYDNQCVIFAILIFFLHFEGEQVIFTCIIKKNKEITILYD